MPWTMFDAITYRVESCAVLAYVACCSILPPFCSILPRFWHPIGFESGRGQPLSGAQGKSVATFPLVTTVGLEPRPGRSPPGELGRAADRLACASPHYLAIPQDLHDPHLRRVGFRVAEDTPAARRPSAWATRGSASHTELSKTIRTIPTY